MSTIVAMTTAVATAATDSTVRTVTYWTLFGGVALGAIVPVIPTGALVSAAAASALYSSYPITALLVIAIGAVAALLGDMVLFGICTLPIGDRLLAWLRRRTNPALLEKSHRQLDEHGIGVLILSRLIPGGRIPIMAAALLLKLSWRWYLAGDAVAAAAWSVTYAAIGVLSGSIFDEQWKGIALAIGLVILVSLGPTLWKRLRRHGADSHGADLPGADLPGADLPGADLPGADSPSGESNSDVADQNSARPAVPPS